MSGLDEEQPEGISRSARWGWGAEVDARVTVDGKVVLAHDETMTRVSGGASRAVVEQSTLADLRAVPLARGGQVTTLWKAVKTAQAADTSLLVELKRWDPTYGSRWRRVGVPKVANTLRRLGMTDRVYLGMGNAGWIRANYPELRTYWKATPGSAAEPTPEWVQEKGFALVQLDPRDYHRRAALAESGVTVGTTNISTKAAWSAARVAGFELFQSGKPGKVAAWCRRQAGSPES